MRIDTEEIRAGYGSGLEREEIQNILIAHFYGNRTPIILVPRTYRCIDYDLRISSLIVFKENRKKVPVCISLNGVILKNDTLMKGNKRMLKLIDNILYKHHKVEDWTPDFMKE